MELIKKIKNNLIVRNCGNAIVRFLYGFKGKSQFGACDSSVILTPPIYVNRSKNVFFGQRMSIGPNAFISAYNAKFICKGNCAIAENLTVHTGNHARLVGLFITDITELNKPKGFDKDVVVEEDVWIGCNVTLLSGVTIGRGATIAAGAVVSKSIPPYCVAGGVPAKFIKFYWTIEQILEHESKLYSKEERYTKAQLEKIFALWNN